MWQDRLKQLIEILEASDVNEIEVGFWGRRFRVSKGKSSSESGNSAQSVEAFEVEAPETQQQELAEATPSQAVEKVEVVEVRAPMVGTFYRAPSPESAPFVEVDDHVSPSQTLCIIEAMKIMNEIESEVAGRVAKILVENVQPVEYGQPLFIIEPD